MRLRPSNRAYWVWASDRQPYLSLDVRCPISERPQIGAATRTLRTWHRCFVTARFSFIDFHSTTVAAIHAAGCGNIERKYQPTGCPRKR